MRRPPFALLCTLSLALWGCDARDLPVDGSASRDAGLELDGAAVDGAGITDAASADPGDAGGGDRESDAGAGDAGPPSDAGPPRDGGAADGGASDGDAGASDGGAEDAGPSGLDAGTDAGAGGGHCISGASGTHAVRFEWAGSGPGSTAYVRYEENQLPDTSRWHVGAYSMSIGYTPRYGDTFLGDGGLELEGTAFIDVELSTAGLSTIRDVTIAIRGRSFNTTASGSFTWQTFDGSGAAPSGSVHNSAPYEWYGADATSAFRAGDDGVLLRIRPGPPSSSLVVNRVEICFDAS